MNEAIKAEKGAQHSAKGEAMLFDAKRENVALQLEAAYRERLAKVHSEVRLEEKCWYWWVVRKRFGCMLQDEGKGMRDMESGEGVRKIWSGFVVRRMIKDLVERARNYLFLIFIIHLILYAYVG